MENCPICNAYAVDIVANIVEGNSQYNTLWFSTNSAVGLKFCPYCGKDISGKVVENNEEDFG